MVAVTVESVPVASAAARRLWLVPDPVSGRRPGALWTVVAALVMGLAFTYLALTPGPAEPAAIPVAGTYVVQAGDSMWSVAQEHAPAGTAAAYVERLVAANDTSTVSPGQVLVLPTS